MTPKDKTLLGFGIPLLIVVATFAYLALANIEIKEDEWSNNATLLAEVGIGIAVALFILMLTKLSEFRMDAKISSILDVIQEREKIRIENENQIYSLICLSLQEIQNKIASILTFSELFKDPNNTFKEFHKNQIMQYYNEIKKLSEDVLDDTNKVSIDFFDVDTLGTIKTISDLCKNAPTFNENNQTVDVSSYTRLKSINEDEICKLNERIREKHSSNRTTLQANTEKIFMSVSSDRTIYPLNSTLYMCANLASVIEGEKIVFQIFNSERRLLLSQILDPENPDYPELAKVNLFEVCFKARGEEWNVGKQYIVRATHGSSYAEDSFTIDRRTPVIQSDKSVYTIGSDMILTVIDPDADMDSDKVEFVGDREDSKIIIESKYGKIDGYRLRETGKSEGIFQGIIGFLPVSKDGKVISQKFGGKTMDKIQGTGIDDGFIGGRPGDEITISYKNSTNIVSLAVFISNFMPVISMDQKAYRPTDKVYLTVVAPDFSLDPEKIDEIGQNPQSTVQIQTSVDRLESYKLVEIGPDTGVFEGELQLVPIDKKPSESSKLRGPNNGIIGCNKEDIIKAVFTWWKDESATAEAVIRL